jgi:hypothetical protein
LNALKCFFVAFSSTFGVLSTAITSSGYSRYPDEDAIRVVSPHLGGRVDREVQRGYETDLLYMAGLFAIVLGGVCFTYP